MKRKSLSLWFSLFLFLCSLCSTITESIAQERPILFTQNSSAELQRIAQTFSNLQNPPVSNVQLAQEKDIHYFVRIAPRDNVLTDKNTLQFHPELLPDALIGTRPFVFFARPEALYGHTLLEIYEDIGYEAEDIIRLQRNQQMVAIIFRYKDGITFEPATDGRLPNDWETKVFSPTWDNALAVFYKLSEKGAIDPLRVNSFSPNQYIFASQAERDWALYHRDVSLDQIKSLSYAGLKLNGGVNWNFRDLLEKKMSLFEHYLGTGYTWNEIKNQPGVHEFIGPNRKVSDMAEVAIVDLGRLEIKEKYALN